MVCHIRFSQPRLCSIELHWPQRRLTVTVPMCQRLPSAVSAGQARYVSACVPLYFSPSPALAAYSVGRLARWSRYMVSQADAVRVHVRYRLAQLQQFARRLEFLLANDQFLVKVRDVLIGLNEHARSHFNRAQRTPYHR